MSRLRSGESEKPSAKELARSQARTKRFLESLEQDNHHSDPHGGDFVVSRSMRSATKFMKSLAEADEPQPSTSKYCPPKKKKKEPRPGSYYQEKYGQPLEVLITQDSQQALQRETKISYSDVNAEDTDFPQRSFCNVCGFVATYPCKMCRMKICSVKCFQIHSSTRCSKY